MKYFILGAVCLVFAACDQKAGSGVGTATFKTDMDSVSYTIGANMGKQASKDSININPDMMAAGYRDAAAGKTMLNDTQMQAVMGSFQMKLMSKQKGKEGADAGKNKAEGEHFLADNAKKPGVKSLPDGLQYEVISEGSGATPTDKDTAVVKYKGTLINGKVFDDSEKHGGTVSFPVTGVIPGWTEALKMMKPGSHWKIYVPGSLAYGQNPPGGDIGPNQTLIFDMELVSVKPAK